MKPLRSGRALRRKTVLYKQKQHQGQKPFVQTSRIESSVSLTQQSSTSRDTVPTRESESQIVAPVTHRPSRYFVGRSVISAGNMMTRLGSYLPIVSPTGDQTIAPQKEGRRPGGLRRGGRKGAKKVSFKDEVALEVSSIETVRGGEEVGEETRREIAELLLGKGAVQGKKM